MLGLWSLIVSRVETIQWVGALVINCVQGKDNTVGRGSAPVINCFQGRDNTVGMAIQLVGGCTGSGKIQSNTELPNTALAMQTLIFTLPCH